MKRIIRPIPQTGVHQTPHGGWIVDGKFDYECEDAEQEPADAVYVATKNAAGVVVEKVNKLPPGKAHRHQRDGWTPPRGKPQGAGGKP